MPIETIRWDPKKISTADILDFYQLTGLKILEYFEEASKNPPMTPREITDPEQLLPLAAFIWIMLRQTRPETTFDEVKAFGVNEITRILTALEIVRTEEQAAPMARRPTGADRRAAKGNEIAELEARLEALKAQAPSA